MIHFEVMKKDALADYTDPLFAIMAENMSVYVKEEAGTEQGKSRWSQVLGEALREHSRNLVLILSDHEIIGFFLYHIGKGTLTIEDMQIASAWQGKSNIFWMLFNFISPSIPETLERIRAKTKKKNAKAHGILLHLGLHPVDETENSYIYEGKYADFLRWFNRK